MQIFHTDGLFNQMASSNMCWMQSAVVFKADFLCWKMKKHAWLAYECIGGFNPAIAEGTLIERFHGVMPASFWYTSILGQRDISVNNIRAKTPRSQLGIIFTVCSKRVSKRTSLLHWDIGVIKIKIALGWRPHHYQHRPCMPNNPNHDLEDCFPPKLMMPGVKLGGWFVWTTAAT